jgi:cell division transport system permease protein
MFSYSQQLKGIIDTDDLKIFGVVFVGVLMLGILISWASTYMAVNKFLRLKFDELFY